MSGAATMRRGACPGLSTPMATGDGLLARLLPIGTLSLDAMAGFCAAARRHGNGILEITSRGSIQVRGLTETSAPPFAEAVARLGIVAQEGVPVISGPLAGLDPNELIAVGWDRLHRQLDAYLDAGLTKFVIRPVGKPPLDAFIDRFVAELVVRQN